MRRLLVVDDAFNITGRGVIVTPKIPAESFKGAIERQVELRNPDGKTLQARAAFAIPRDSKMDPNHPYFLCLVREISTDDVPIGTELWLVDGDIGDAG
jgi:hypothetical protein